MNDPPDDPDHALLANRGDGDGNGTNPADLLSEDQRSERLKQLSGEIRTLRNIGYVERQAGLNFLKRAWEGDPLLLRQCLAKIRYSAFRIRQITRDELPTLYVSKRAATVREESTKIVLNDFETACEVIEAFLNEHDYRGRVQHDVCEPSYALFNNHRIARIRPMRHVEQMEHSLYVYEKPKEMETAHEVEQRRARDAEAMRRAVRQARIQTRPLSIEDVLIRAEDYELPMDTSEYSWPPEDRNSFLGYTSTLVPSEGAEYPFLSMHLEAEAVKRRAFDEELARRSSNGSGNRSGAETGDEDDSRPKRKVNELRKLFMPKQAKLTPKKLNPLADKYRVQEIPLFDPQKVRSKTNSVASSRSTTRSRRPKPVITQERLDDALRQAAEAMSVLDREKFLKQIVSQRGEEFLNAETAVENSEANPEEAVLIDLTEKDPIVGTDLSENAQQAPNAPLAPTEAKYANPLQSQQAQVLFQAGTVTYKSNGAAAALELFPDPPKGHQLPPPPRMLDDDVPAYAPEEKGKAPREVAPELPGATQIYYPAVKYETRPRRISTRSGNSAQAELEDATFDRPPKDGEESQQAVAPKFPSLSGFFELEQPPANAAQADWLGRQTQFPFRTITPTSSYADGAPFAKPQTPPLTTPQEYARQELGLPIAPAEAQRWSRTAIR